MARYHTMIFITPSAVKYTLEKHFTFDKKKLKKILERLEQIVLILAAARMQLVVANFVNFMI